MHPRPFPPEIWSQAISWLPMADKKSFLEVSRFFYELTLPFVFSSVRIFILGGSKTLEMLDTNNIAFAHATEERLMRRSCEILLRIVVDAKFASFVKDMTVVISTEYPASFEILTLTEAFGALRNLQTLRCYGAESSAPLYEEILQAVPSTLNHIIYSTQIRQDITSGLPDLECLEHHTTVYFPEDGASDLIIFPLALANITLNLNASTHSRLRFLSIDAVEITNVPVWVYEQLKSLEIHSGDPNTPVDFDFICHHCPDLEEFSATGEIRADFCLSLPRATLPKLHSLRLSCEGAHGDAVEDEHFAALSNFIRAHKTLRRLYLRFPNAVWSQLIPACFQLKELQSLQVFGLHTGNRELNEAELMEIMHYLPLTMKALQLSMSWDSNTGQHVPIIMNRLSAMPNLKFLHIYGIYTRLPFSPEELAMDLKGLTRVGLTRALWDIYRDPHGQVDAAKWPRWKIKYFAESDFEDVDDAWLFKYH